MVFNLLGDKVATPSTFVVDQNGVIAWKYVANSIGDRPPTSIILDQLASLGGNPPATYSSSGLVRAIRAGMSSAYGRTA